MTPIPEHSGTARWRASLRATDQEFSVLPAENSSGNWVKVVQRVPVRVDITPDPHQPPLSAGMSAEVSIDTHHHRTLARSVLSPCPAADQHQRTGRSASRPHHDMRDGGDNDAGARLDHRERRAAVYAGQSVGELRRDHLGPDLLHRRRRDHDGAGRLAGGALRLSRHLISCPWSASPSLRCCAASPPRWTRWCCSA